MAEQTTLLGQPIVREQGGAGARLGIEELELLDRLDGVLGPVEDKEVDPSGYEGRKHLPVVAFMNLHERRELERMLSVEALRLGRDLGQRLDRVQPPEPVLVQRPRDHQSAPAAEPGPDLEAAFRADPPY